MAVSQKISAAKRAKMELADSVAKELESAKVVAVIDMKEMPNKVFWKIRRSLAGRVKFRVTRKSVMKFALQKTSKLKDIAPMVDSIQPGLMISDENPFKLYKAIMGCRTKAFARGGKITPIDLIVPAGDTGLPPGPAIGDLQKAGIPARIQGGKIVVPEDFMLAKAGTPVKKEAAEALIKLGVEPFEIKLNVLAVWEDGLIYDSKILAIDDVKVAGDLAMAHSRAMNLAVETGYTCRETVVCLIQKAATFANALNARVSDAQKNADVSAKQTETGGN